MDQLRKEIQSIWQKLSQCNEWQLVQDEELFFNDVISEYHTLNRYVSQSFRGSLRLAVIRTYSVLLYRGMVQRQDRSAQELWLAFMRYASSRCYTAIAAQDLAQETICRMFEKLHQLRVPQGLISWGFRIFRTVQREIHAQSALLQDLDVAQVNDIIDTVDLATEVEHRLIIADMLALFRVKLPNHLQRQVLVHILLGGSPRDIARDLSVPLARARLAKHRAIEQVRNDGELLQFIRELSGDYS